MRISKSLLVNSILSLAGSLGSSNVLVMDSVPAAAQNPISVGTHRRSRYRGPGKANPAGSKLARMAAEGRLGTKRMSDTGRNAQMHATYKVR